MLKNVVLASPNLKNEVPPKTGQGHTGQPPRILNRDVAVNPGAENEKYYNIGAGELLTFRFLVGSRLHKHVTFPRQTRPGQARSRPPDSETVGSASDGQAPQAQSPRYSREDAPNSSLPTLAMHGTCRSTGLNPPLCPSYWSCQYRVGDEYIIIPAPKVRMSSSFRYVA
jgi:hypothetical protein